MSFNWFNRPAEETPPAPTEETIATPIATTPTEALTFAKAAYDRLKQKQQATAPDVPVEDIAEEPIEDPTAEEPSEPDVPTDRPMWMQSQAETEARLDRLRETAIEEPIAVVEPVKVQQYVYPPDLILDDGFAWSAEVLAGQGRRVEDISLEEITWLKRLRQGLDKTRRNLVNQLKAIVGQGQIGRAHV